jgi:hypothetical protein
MGSTAGLNTTEKSLPPDDNRTPVSGRPVYTLVTELTELSIYLPFRLSIHLSICSSTALVDLGQFF